jgi:Zn-dependent protease with chaperone function
VDDFRLLTLLLIGLLVVLTVSLPFRLGGIVLAVGGIWTSVRVFRGLSAARRAGRPARGAVGAGLGLGMSVVLLLLLVMQAATYPLVAELERCREAAATRTAAEACRQDAQNRVDDWVRRLSEAGGGR